MNLDTFLNIIKNNKESIVIGVAIVFIIILIFIYKKSRRISHIEDLPRNCNGMWLKGRVTHVGDGDGFRFFHTPFMRSKKPKRTDGKLYIRLAGVDAPEVRKFNIAQQPFSKESKDFLSKLILNKIVDIKLLGVDRYNRVLAIVFLKGWFKKINVNLEMVKSGFACVYTGIDAKYDIYEEQMKKLENIAKIKKAGMWKGGQNVITPMQYKRNHR